MKKTLIYSILVITVIGLVGVGLASAQGWFGFNHFKNTSSEEMAQKKEAMLQQKADALGISVEELIASWAEKTGEKKELILQQKADFLGISIDELKSALEQGMSYEEIMEEYGIDMDELKTHMMGLKHDKMGDWGMKKDFHKGFKGHFSK